jgi:hypothetical protein
MLSDKNTVTDVQMVSDDMIEVQYKTEAEFRTTHSFANVVIAAFITAWGRVELFNHIKSMGERCLYVDTDSMIFSGEGPPVGKGLIGELTDEIEASHGVKDTIHIFTATGPKSYAYQLKKNRSITQCKVKGITLSHKASQLINLETITQMLQKVDDDPESISVTACNSIRRNKEDKVITSQDITKSFRVTSDKRVKLKGKYVTLPYGHKDIPGKDQKKSPTQKTKGSKGKDKKAEKTYQKSAI